MIQPVDLQYNRAVRWLGNMANKKWPPPGHIIKKILAQQKHLIAGGFLPETLLEDLKRRNLRS